MPAAAVEPGNRRTRRARGGLTALVAAAAVLTAAGPAQGRAGDVIVSDSVTFGPNNGGLIRVDALTGARSTLTENNAPAGGAAMESPNAIAFEADGHIVVADSWSVGGVRTPRVVRVDRTTGVRTLVSDNASPAGGPSFVEPTGIAVEADGSILVSDISTGPNGNGAIIRVDPVTGVRTLVSQNGSPVGTPKLANPWDIALDGSGSIIVIDADNPLGSGGKVIRVDPVTGVRTLISRNGNPAGAPSFAWPWWITMDGSDVLVSDMQAFGGTGGIIRIDPATGVRTRVSRNTNPAGAPLFTGPADLAMKGSDVVVNDPGSDAVLRVDPATGIRTTLSSNSAPAGLPDFSFNYGIAVEPLILIGVVLAPGGVIRPPGGGGGNDPPGGNDSPGNRGGHRGGAAAGAALRFRLSAAARVTVQVDRLRTGRIVGRSCRPLTAANRGGPRCRAATTVGTLRFQGTVGANRRALPAQFRGRALPAGSYRAIVRATSAAGDASVPVGVRFRVVRG